MLEPLYDVMLRHVIILRERIDIRDADLGQFGTQKYRKVYF